MKLISPLISLMAATLLLPFAFSTPVSEKVNEVKLVRKAFRPHGAPAADHVSTNAERFARGLPPLSPSKSRNHGSPTRRDAVSPLPPVTYKGYIEIDVNGSQVGYMATKSYTEHPDAYYGVTFSDSDTKLIVTFSLPAGQTSGSGLNLVTLNSELSIGSYLGLASESTKFESGLDYAVLTGTAASEDGPSAGANAAGFSYIESNVWSVNVDTGELNVTWTNGDGSIGDYATVCVAVETIVSVRVADAPITTLKFIPISA